MLALVNRTITIYQFVFGVLTASLQKVGYRIFESDFSSQPLGDACLPGVAECDHA